MNDLVSAVTTPEILGFIAILGGLSALVGVLAGLLGIGGGLILVPALFDLLQGLGATPEAAIRTAVGTSLATVVATGLRTARAHAVKGSLDLGLVSAWAPGMVLGGFLGAEIATRIDATALKAIFATMTCVLALNMAFGKQQWRVADAPPGFLTRLPLGSVAGIVSAMLGIGVAAVGVPLMTAFGAALRGAVAAVAFLGACTAAAGAVRFAWQGWDAAGLAPWSLGYVNILGFALIVPLTMLFAPLGVRFAHAVSQQVLRRFFAALLFVVAGRLLWQAYG